MLELFLQQFSKQGFICCVYMPLGFNLRYLKLLLIFDYNILVQ